MNRTTRVVLTLLAIFAVVLPLHAAITGGISGTVTDPTGAAVPGVTVVALNQETGISLTQVTDGRGYYDFTTLNVGLYTITATGNGFQNYKVTSIKVDANSELRADVKFKVGGGTVTEVVNGNALQIETQSTQLGEVIESQKITAVPLNGRSYTDLLSLQPGVSPYNGTTETVGAPSGDLNPGNVSINGGREASNGFMVNGGDVNDGVQNGAAIIPNLDSISEFRIITNNFDAEYGNFSGGQVNVVTKSGTNSFHGSAFEFFRNTALNSSNYFTAPGTPKGAFNQNIYGGTVGGPIRKDKIFFFGDFQGTNQTQGATQNFPVYSAADLGGNLSDQLTLNPCTFGTVNSSNVCVPNTVSSTGWASYLSNQLGYTVTQGEPYYMAGCTSSANCVLPNATIPTTAFDPAAKALLKYFPSQTYLSGNGTPYFSTSANSSTLTDKKEAGRVDANTRYGTLFGYYFLDNDTVNNPYAGGSVPGFAGITTSRDQMANLGLTTIRKSNAVNTFRFTYMRSANHTNKPTSTGTTLSSLGFDTNSSTGGITNINPALAGVPNVNLNNFGFGNPTETQGKYDNTFQFLDNFMKVVGTHTMQYGGNYHYDQIMERNNYAVNGLFSFNGQETGLDLSDYLLGDVADGGGFVQASIQLLDTRSQYISAYVEDSWRVRQNLTLNYGLRYEIITPWYDATNKLETAIPGVQSKVFPGAPEGYLVPGDPGVPRTLAPIRYDNFAPRFGFAYAPKNGDALGKLLGGDKFSIRGGFGTFYTNIQDESGFIEVGDAPFGDYYSSSYPVQFSKPFVDVANQTVLPSPFPFTFPATNVSASNPDTTFNWASVEPIAGSALLKTNDKIPYIMSYYLSVQRELGRNTVLTANYVGSQGRRLMTFEEANPGNQALCVYLSNPANLQSGQTPCGPGGEQASYTELNGTVINSTRSIFGQALGSNGYMASAATSNYNSLQMTLKHESAMWNMLLGYTYGRSFDDASGLTDVTNVIQPHLSYGLSSFNYTQYFVGSYDVKLPFDRLTPNHWAKHAVEGWSVTGITKLATGLPVNISENDDQSLVGTGGVDQPNYTPGKLHANHNPRFGGTYFNTSLFSEENFGTFGTSHRRFFSGPGLDNTDLALLRDFHIYKTHEAEFRAEAFNAFNHAQFNNPGGNFSNQSSFGIVSSANPSRILQLAVKYKF